MPSYFRKVSRYSLKKLPDASESGYGQASYLRLVDEKGKINCSISAL